MVPENYFVIRFHAKWICSVFTSGRRSKDHVLLWRHDMFYKIEENILFRIETNVTRMNHDILVEKIIFFDSKIIYSSFTSPMMILYVLVEYSNIRI